METTIENKVKEYLATMSPKELKAYEIAKAHLGDSFQMKKSIGFLAWYKSQTK